MDYITQHAEKLFLISLAISVIMSIIGGVVKKKIISNVSSLLSWLFIIAAILFFITCVQHQPKNKYDIIYSGNVIDKANNTGVGYQLTLKDKDGEHIIVAVPKKIYKHAKYHDFVQVRQKLFNTDVIIK